MNLHRKNVYKPSKSKSVAKEKDVVKTSHKRKTLTPSHLARKEAYCTRKNKAMQTPKPQCKATEVKSSNSDDVLGIENHN